MEMRVDALDFTQLQQALDIQSWSAKLVDTEIDMMTEQPRHLAVSQEIQQSTVQDPLASGTGSIYDQYV